MLTLPAYNGGNNGNVFAEYIVDNHLFNPYWSCDDYCKLAKNVPYEHINFPKWIQNDDFWGDFVCRMEELRHIVTQ